MPRPTGSGSAARRASSRRLGERLRDPAGDGASPLDFAELLVNDLEPAALSLRPEIADALDALREAGASAALVTGSGPTAFGLFADIAAGRRGGRGASAALRGRDRRRPRRAIDEAPAISLATTGCACR